MRILPGLPPYGPTPEPFPASGERKHQVGFVVEIEDGQGGRWTGNFQRGATTFDAIFETLGADRPVIVAGGSGYLVDAATRAQLATFGGDINFAQDLPDRGLIILADDHRLHAVGRDGLVWRSRRVSLDGMDTIVVCDGVIHGMAYAPGMDDHPAEPFEIDLATGAEKGGTYSEDWERKPGLRILAVATMALHLLALSVFVVPYAIEKLAPRGSGALPGNFSLAALIVWLLLLLYVLGRFGLKARWAALSVGWLLIPAVFIGSVIALAIANNILFGHQPLPTP